ncbi:MAG: hypothetical protein SP1CHLAM54_07920 [Chlamydiia bacterium]|nr:hypothetical protein [Chlamydiia bacterium]MCH9615698.1 hypothetical protein [Chlamydiia bacterium]MCH9628899.1 hypothetical protein [Chlamydiia bacterium]
MAVRVGMTGECEYIGHVHALYVHCVVDGVVKPLPIEQLRNDPALHTQLDRIETLHNMCCPKRQDIVGDDPPLVFNHHHISGQLHFTDGSPHAPINSLVALQRRNSHYLLSMRGVGVVDITHQMPKVRQALEAHYHVPYFDERDTTLTAVLITGVSLFIFFGILWYTASHE